jgi:hypothetical protein
MSYARNLLARGEEVIYESRQHWFAVVARTWLWIVLAVVSLAIMIFVLSGTEPIGNETIDGLLTIVAVALLIASLGWIGFVIWDWRNQEWLITTRRVIRAEGVLNKSVSDSSLEKINDARLDQSLFGRIFGFGTLDILTAAEEFNNGSNIADFPMIADPVDFKKAMFDQKQMLENPDLAPRRSQRPMPAPQMERAEPMPPRAGSDRVAIHHDDGDDAVAAAPPPAQPAAPAAAPVESAAPRTPADELAGTLERLASLRDKGLITPEEYDAKKRDLLERM